MGCGNGVSCQSHVSIFGKDFESASISKRKIQQDEIEAKRGEQDGISGLEDKGGQLLLVTPTGMRHGEGPQALGRFGGRCKNWRKPAIAVGEKLHYREVGERSDWRATSWRGCPRPAREEDDRKKGQTSQAGGSSPPWIETGYGETKPLTGI